MNMKLAGWLLLPSCLVGFAVTVAIMIMTFNRLSAAGGSAKPSDLAQGIGFAILSALVGIGLSISGVVLLALAGRAARRRTQGFPVQQPPV
jgi:hypothetical protein